MLHVVFGVPVKLQDLYCRLSCTCQICRNLVIPLCNLVTTDWICSEKIRVWEFFKSFLCFRGQELILCGGEEMKCILRDCVY